MEFTDKKAARRLSGAFILKGCALGALLVYVIFSPLVMRPAYYCYLFWSRPYDKSLYDKAPYKKALGIEPQDVFFDTVGGKLHGWYFKKPGSKNTILFCHGKGGNLTMFGYEAASLVKVGPSVLVFDYKGMGRSTGKPSLLGLQEDIDAAYNFLINEQQVSPDTLIVYAESLSTAPAAKLIAEKPCKGAVLRAPYTSLQGAGKRFFPHLALYPSFLYPEPDLCCVPYTEKFVAPTLIVHGTQDRDIPVAEGDAVFKSLPCRKTLLHLANSGHYQCSSAMWLKLMKEYELFFSSLDQAGENKVQKRELQDDTTKDLGALPIDDRLSQGYQIKTPAVAPADRDAHKRPVCL